METLVLDGKRYVKASKVASDLGYTSDYVGQLCRSGQVRAHLVGRTWYVDEEQLSTHRVEKKRMARVKAREHAKKTLAEYRAQAVVTKSKKAENAVHIRYEEDAADLLPPVRKLNIAVARDKPAAQAKVAVHREAEKAEPAYEIENPGEKIVMQGKLKLVDLNDGEQLSDENTVVMVPRINRKVVKPATRERALEPIAPAEVVADESYGDEEEEDLADEELDSSVSATPQRKTFAERMLAEGVLLTPTAADEADREVADGGIAVTEITTELAEVEETTESRASWWAPLLIVAAALAITVGTLGLVSSSDYFDNSKEEPTFQSGYTVDFGTLMQKIYYKI